MMRRHAPALLLALLAGCTHKDAEPPPRVEGPMLRDVGPRIVSNETAYPLMLYGRGFRAGSRLTVGGIKPQTLETRYIDAQHLGAVLPAEMPIALGRSSEKVLLGVVDPEGRPMTGQVELEVVNDVEVPTPLALEVSPDDKWIFVVSSTTDRLWRFDRDRPEAPPVERRAGDRPRALARWSDPAGRACLIIGHEYGRALWLLPMDDIKAEPRIVALPGDVQDLIVAGDRAYVSSAMLDRVLVIDLVTGKAVGELPTGVDPRALAIDAKRGRALACNALSEDFSIAPLDGKKETRVTALPGTPILGGPTEKYAKYVMGAKPGRGAVIVPGSGLALVATIGPNIGPNPDRWEVTMNGGVSVLDLEHARYVRHLATGGVPQALALDAERHLLYVADGATGQIVALDEKLLTESDASARKAIVARYDVAPPSELPLIRPAADFTTHGRSSTALHSGPWALRLAAGGTRLVVLNRFSRSVVELDVSKRGVFRPLRTYRLPDHPALQQQRRLGEIIYYTDLGHSSMTCDTCHPDGHEGGVLYTKTTPIRIYRSPTLRAIKQSPPYFTPSKLPSLMATCIHVLSRNRYHNPDPTPEECRALTEYTELIPTPPNPFVGAGGALPTDLALPDGEHGDALAGLALFDGKAGCANASCHPPPHFTADQSPLTRGRWLQVGTPIQLPLRLEMQDTVDYGQPPVALIGAWDSFPLLDSGASGLDVAADGTLRPTHPFALRRVLELKGDKPHGDVAGLSPRETNDLLAYLLTL